MLDIVKNIKKRTRGISRKIGPIGQMSVLIHL